MADSESSLLCSPGSEHADSHFLFERQIDELEAMVPHIAQDLSASLVDLKSWLDNW